MPARLSIALVIACLLTLAGHVAGGHAHVDLLDAAPLATHEPGDEHHQDSASCDALRSAAGTPAAPTVAVLPIPVLVDPDRAPATVVSVLAPLRSGSSLLLLYAVLLI